mmetsp:Transcript_80990/g.177790  ORF Transcript_80990/g.177790 Transcript_80990/m.177790 type:complete len:333 (-) Transcript_80990:487-1485(-)
MAIYLQGRFQKPQQLQQLHSVCQGVLESAVEVVPIEEALEAREVQRAARASRRVDGEVLALPGDFAAPGVAAESDAATVVCGDVETMLRVCLKANGFQKLDACRDSRPKVPNRCHLPLIPLPQPPHQGSLANVDFRCHRCRHAATCAGLHSQQVQGVALWCQFEGQAIVAIHQVRVGRRHTVEEGHRRQDAKVPQHRLELRPLVVRPHGKRDVSRRILGLPRAQEVQEWEEELRRIVDEVSTLLVAIHFLLPAAAESRSQERVRQRAERAAATLHDALAADVEGEDVAAAAAGALHPLALLLELSTLCLESGSFSLESRLSFPMFLLHRGLL